MLDLLRTRNVSAVAARPADQFVKEDVIPVASHTERADADVQADGLIRQFEAARLVTIRMAIGQQDQVIAAARVQSATEFLHAGLKASEYLGRAAGLDCLDATLGLI